MSDGLRGDLSEADVAAVVRNNPEAVVDAIRNQAIEPSEVESDSSSTDESDVGELSGNVTGNTTLNRIIGGDAGEVIPVGSVGVGEQRSVSFTSTSYARFPQQMQNAFYYSDLQVKNGTLVFGYSFFANPGTDETVDTRIQNRQDGETVVEVLGAVYQWNWSGWTAYEPPTTTAPVPYETQHRTSPGSNSSTITAPTLFVGVRLP